MKNYRINGPTLLQISLFLILSGSFAAPDAFASNSKTSAAARTTASHLKSPKPKTQAGERRTIQFACDNSLGTLYLEVANEICAFTGEPIRPAFGKVTIFVPEDSRLVYEPNRLAIQQPKLMSGITPRGIDILRLQALEVDESEKGLCDRVIKYAAEHFKDLRELVVDSSDVSDEGLAHLRNMPDLEAISTMSCQAIKGQCFEALSKLPNLQRLSLRGHQIDDLNYKYLPLFPKLTYLSLRRTGIGEAGLREVSQCSRLTNLDLSDNDKVDDKCLAALSPLKNLRKLSVCATAATDRGMEFLSHLPALKSLAIIDTRVTLKGVAVLKPLRLEELGISGWYSQHDLQKLGPVAGRITFGLKSKSVDDDVGAVFAPLH